MAQINSLEITEFQDILLVWFRRKGRNFLWRQKKLSNYKLVITEALLQCTKAETVNRFYNDFFRAFPNWRTIACCDLFKIEQFLRPIGLQRQRAARLKNLAIEIQKRKGVFPKDRSELENIPFLGQYIANAVELLIFKVPLPLLDVNMSRVLERYFKPRALIDIRYDPLLQNLALNVVNVSNSKELIFGYTKFSFKIMDANMI